MRTDFPKMKPIEQGEAELFIVDFYRQLGWDGQSELDPRQIAINEQQWQDCCKTCYEAEEGQKGGLLWMNYGPSGDASIPYGKVEVEQGAFLQQDQKLADADKQMLDEALGRLLSVEGRTVFLDADVGETNESLLQTAYDARHLPSEEYLATLREQVSENWVDSIDLAVDAAIEESGITPYQDARYDLAREYVTESYDFQPPYWHYFTQDMKVNILLGTKEETNLDFSSIHVMCDCLTDPSRLSDPQGLDAETLDNGLMWLVQQQGYSLDDLQGAIRDYEEQGYDPCQEARGPFLTSIAAELYEFPNIMGTVCVLANLSIDDLAKSMGESITMPKNSTVGLFAPWVGGGAPFNITLEKELTIPPDVRFDLQIEGAKNNAYTAQDVYGLTDSAWKSPTHLSNPIEQEIRPIEDIIKQAKQKAVEHSQPLPSDRSLANSQPEIGH